MNAIYTPNSAEWKEFKHYLKMVTKKTWEEINLNELTSLSELRTYDSELYLDFCISILTLHFGDLETNGIFPLLAFLRFKTYEDATTITFSSDTYIKRLIHEHKTSLVLFFEKELSYRQEEFVHQTYAGRDKDLIKWEQRFQNPLFTYDDRPISNEPGV